MYFQLFVACSVFLELEFCMAIVERGKETKGLDLYYYNATSIRGKLLDFNNFFTSHDHEIICVTETWLNSAVHDGEILDNIKHTIHRKDRDLERTKKKDGGGTLCAVSNNLRSSRRYDFENDDLEMLWVEISMPNKGIFVGTVYLPPGFKLETLALLDSSIELALSSMNEFDHLVIVGDINCRDIQWSYDANDQLIVSNPDELSSISSRFIEVLDCHNLSQFNSNVTCNNAVLDLVITDGAQAVCNTTDNATTSTHHALDVNIDIP